MAPRGPELSDAETATLTEAVNEIWGAAAIRWEVVAGFREEAVESQAWVDMVEGRAPATTSAVLSVLPMDNRVAGEWDAFLVRELGAARRARRARPPAGSVRLSRARPG